eukprot:TRINITY_DN2916_c0_g5_i1.p1 TRINITY_DN2916_c0_g5~~TRINITY_DN2916_c0_g5_i1.p1  ORF type:complete len:384 (+),score=99.82 TRINITY_DN2916_c0_g5_i1:98-1249(+)
MCIRDRTLLEESRVVLATFLYESLTHILIQMLQDNHKEGYMEVEDEDYFPHFVPRLVRDIVDFHSLLVELRPDHVNSLPRAAITSIVDFIAFPASAREVYRMKAQFLGVLCAIRERSKAEFLASISESIEAKRAFVSGLVRCFPSKETEKNHVHNCVAHLLNALLQKELNSIHVVETILKDQSLHDDMLSFYELVFDEAHSILEICVKDIELLHAGPSFQKAHLISKKEQISALRNLLVGVTECLKLPNRIRELAPDFTSQKDVQEVILNGVVNIISLSKASILKGFIQFEIDIRELLTTILELLCSTGPIQSKNISADNLREVILFAAENSFLSPPLTDNCLKVTQDLLAREENENSSSKAVTLKKELHEAQERAKQQVVQK